MDLNHVLIWMTLTMTLLTLLRLKKRHESDVEGWKWVHRSIAAGTVCLIGVAPAWAGYIGFTALMALSIIPSIGFRIAQRAFFRHHFRLAKLLFSLVKWLHPSQVWRDYPSLMQAFLWAQKNRIDDATALLRSFEGSETVGALLANTQLYVLQGRWDDLYYWLNNRRDLLQKSPTLIPHFLRASGETGNLNAMLSDFERYKTLLGTPGLELIRSQSQLCIAAFCGRLSAVHALFEGSLQSLATSVKGLWLLTARMATGELDAQADTRKALSTADPILRLQYERRLQFPPVNPLQILSTLDYEKMALIDQDIQQDQQYGYGRVNVYKPWMTYVLIGINIFMFMMEWRMGGSMNSVALTKLGALDLTTGFHRQYSSLLAANFLHMGWLHLLMNMFALYLLGPFVERSLGKVRYLVTYLISGIGAFTGIVFVHHLRGSPGDLTVGASGSIMGIVGATGAILWMASLKNPMPVARRRLKDIGIVIGIQTLFDITTPQVSFTGHIGGLLTGFLIVILLKAQESIRKPVLPVGQ